MQEWIAERIILHVSAIETLVLGISISVVDALCVHSLALAYALCKVAVLSSKYIFIQGDINTEYTLFHEYGDAEVNLSKDESIEVIDITF